jgi:hypothetical protein
MNDALRSPYILLVGLAAVGVLLAGAGTALGITQPFVQSESSDEFVVTEHNVTFEAGGHSETVVRNMTHVQDISIVESTDGQFTVNTTEAHPLTALERKQAREIALANETVRTGISSIGDYRVSVDGIRKINDSSFETVSINTTQSEQADGKDYFVIQTNGTASGDGDGAVTIQREPNYVEDRASVRLYRLGTDEDDLKYSTDVDLAHETVTAVTDWDRVRENAETITATARDGEN